mgnify:CR=1 FL=1
MAENLGRVRLHWNGDNVARRIREASRLGIDDTMAQCAITAKGSHPGWKNVTSNAEGSISIVRPAWVSQLGGKVIGWWGSKGVLYMIFLEVKHGAALRASADKNYPSLSRRIKQHLRGMAS